MVSFTGVCPISAREGEAKFWITLYIRSSQNGTIAGIPYVLFFAPEISGGTDKKKDLPDERLTAL